MSCRPRVLSASYLSVSSLSASCLSASCLSASCLSASCLSASCLSAWCAVGPMSCQPHIPVSCRPRVPSAECLSALCPLSLVSLDLVSLVPTIHAFNDDHRLPHTYRTNAAHGAGPITTAGTTTGSTADSACLIEGSDHSFSAPNEYLLVTSVYVYVVDLKMPYDPSQGKCHYVLS